MSQKNLNFAVTLLQWTLGVVILVEAILFLLPSSQPQFARTHLPELVRQVLGWGEIIGAILLLVPQTAVRGSWVLIGIFVLAIILHLLHGMYNVGNLLIYGAAAWTIAAGKSYRLQA
jgi:DoxX-like family